MTVQNCLVDSVYLELEAGVEGVVSGPLGDHGDPRAQLLLQLQVTTNLGLKVFY